MNPSAFLLRSKKFNSSQPKPISNAVHPANDVLLTYFLQYWLDFSFFLQHSMPQETSWRMRKEEGSIGLRGAKKANHHHHGIDRLAGAGTTVL